MDVRDETIRKHDDRMANDEVLGPRKTMFVLVIVVGCFAVLWPRILSPLLAGSARDQLKPNQFDRDAGCCEVMFETDLTMLGLINEVCKSVVQTNGKLSPYSAAECRKAVNETCGLDIAAFLKKTDNIGKSAKILVRTMQSSNSSCLKEHFGLPFVSLGPHTAINSWTLQDTVKQERSPIRGAGPHPALRERGRAIPAGAAPAPPSRGSHIQMPPNVRVRTSPLAGYFEMDVKPPPIPGMRPPLGSPGGPVPAPKSSMGFVMPIYTICIIVFFVYTISKLLFKRATIPYEPVTPDPQFRRRVFREDSRSSPDKLVVSAISGLVAEVQQQMEASYAQNQQRQDVQDNHARPYTNGTIIHNSGPVHIIASEYRGKNRSSEPSTDPKESTPDASEKKSKCALDEVKEVDEDNEVKEKTEAKEVNETKIEDEVIEEDNKANKAEIESEEKITRANKENDVKEQITGVQTDKAESVRESLQSEDKETADSEPVPQEDVNHTALIDLTEPAHIKKNGDVVSIVTEFLREEAKSDVDRIGDNTKELLEEAIDEDDGEQENASVKVVGMEVTAHSADGGTYSPPPAAVPAPPPAAQPPRPPHEAREVQSIYLDTAIPQQTRVLVAACGDGRPAPPASSKHSPMVVSGKMTLSLIQDAPRETPERDAESTMDDFTTASALTQNAEKEDESDDELEEEEIEIEEIEEEVEDEEVEEVEEEEEEPVKTGEAVKKGTE